jgi:Flp pilus assembly protein TadG
MNTPLGMGLMRSPIVSLARMSLGSAAVELAITAPVLVLLALGAADYGALMGNGASLEGATRAVAEYARNSPECNTATGGGWLANNSCITGINNLVSTLQSNDTAVAPATSTLSSATFTLPGLGNIPVGAASPTPGNYCTCTDGSAVSCSVVSCKLADPRVIQYIQITATLPVSPLVSYANKFTFPGSLNAQTTTRIQ